MRTRIRTMLRMDGIAILIFLLALIVFNIGVRWQMAAKCKEALEEALAVYDEEETDSLYHAEVIFLIDDPRVANSEMSGYTRKEKQIIEWYRENETVDLQKAKIGPNTYYLKAEQDYDKQIGDFSSIAYVDVSGEPELINRFNLAFLITAVIVVGIGTVQGYRLGKRLEQNEYAQKSFFENTSHEFMTPIAAIRSYAEGIEKGIITDYPKTGRLIIAQTRQMSRLVEELLLLAQVESGSLVLQREEYGIRELMESCLASFELAAAGRQLQVDLQLEDGKVMMDSIQMRHAISNLLANALRYAASRVEIIYQKNVLRIWNDCEVLPDEELKHLFDRFYTGRLGNTGIGLALAKDIIELHGFRLAAESRDGGITFIITLA